MASIVKRGKSFRVRWVDFDGTRKSASFNLHKEALEFSRRKEVEIDEIKLGIKAPTHRFLRTLTFYTQQETVRTFRTHFLLMPNA